MSTDYVLEMDFLYSNRGFVEILRWFFDEIR